MKKIATCLYIIFTGFAAHAQDMSLYTKRWIVQGKDTMPYRLLLPENYDAAKTYPVIFFLHGSGERGDDNEKQLVHGAALFLKPELRKKYPAIVVFPQCAKDGYWSNVLRTFDATQKIAYNFIAAGEPTADMRLLQQLVKYILQTYPVKNNRVYVGGLSMGGMGTFELVRRMPGIFAAAFPICGGAVPSTAKAMSGVKWWIFHGAKDDVVDMSFSQKMAESLKKEKAQVRFTVYPGANHNSWDPAFAEPGLADWLFAQQR